MGKKVIQSKLLGSIVSILSMILMTSKLFIFLFFLLPQIEEMLTSLGGNWANGQKYYQWIKLAFNNWAIYSDYNFISYYFAVEKI